MRRPQLVWLKRDLRIEDHKPLFEASLRGPCVVLYIYEPEVISGPDYDARHLLFINESLRALSDALKKLGSTLTIQRGEAVEVLSALHRRHGFEALYSHEETGNAVTFARDLRVKAWANEVGLRWHEYRQFGVVRGLKNRDGWAKQWNQMMAQPTAAVPTQIEALLDVTSCGVLPPGELGLSSIDAEPFQRGGSEQARRVLRSFLNQRGQAYQFEMSSPLFTVDAFPISSV